MYASLYIYIYIFVCKHLCVYLCIFVSLQQVFINQTFSYNIFLSKKTIRQLTITKHQLYNDTGLKVLKEKLVALHSLAGHTIDETVASRVHVPDAPRDSKYGEAKADHNPQNDVEDSRVHGGELWRQI